MVGLGNFLGNKKKKKKQASEKEKKQRLGARKRITGWKKGKGGNGEKEKGLRKKQRKMKKNKVAAELGKIRAKERILVTAWV